MILLGSSVDHTDDHVYVDFTGRWNVLSSAVLNGGLLAARGVVNQRVRGNCHRPEEGLSSPEAVLAAYCEAQQWRTPVVGLMTAASMRSFRYAVLSEGDTVVAALVTSGLANALCAGDTAAYRSLTPAMDHAGTINTVVLTNVNMVPPTMVEAVAIASEAKASVLQEAGVKSRVSGAAATGTGTDSIVIACEPSGPPVKFCGKHVLLGELIGKSVRQALGESIQWDLQNT